MKNYLGIVLALLFLLGAMSGCCQIIESNPPRPAHVRGWQKFKQGQFDAMGEFVLETGKSVDNGTIGISLVEIVKGKSCSGGESTGPGAVLRIYRVSDNQTLLQIALTEGNTRLINFNKSLVEDYGVDTISIREINTRGNWIWFEVWS